ncbi:MAG: NepR family anti-sigma factor [Beijerinckiaceae bacterium]
MGNPVEQGTKIGTTPPARADTTGSLGGPETAQAQGPSEAAEVTSLARVRARKAEPKSEIIEQIGRRLQSVYNDVLFQPVPERFHDLMRTLERDLAADGAPPAASAEKRRKKESK